MTTALIPYVPPFVAHGSHGDLTFCSLTGRVWEADGCDCGDCADGYRDIIRVDVAELRQFYADHWPGELERCRDGLDVLELGWWTRTGYVPAEETFRLDMLNRCRDGIEL